MTDYDRLKVSIYQFLFAEETRHSEKLETLSAKLRKQRGDEWEDTVRYLAAQLQNEEFKRLRKNLFDILRSVGV